MNKKLLSGTLIIGLFLLFGFAIFQMMNLSELKYSISSAEESNNNLEKQISSLKVDLSENVNLNNFEEKILEEGYEQIGKIDYILVSSNGDIASR